MNKNFLSKKSWHTGSIKHMEKVWKAEQVADDESRKLAVLKRELNEEQKIYELKKLAEESSGKPRTERLEWMYTIKKGPSTEEYLMGKPLTQAEEEKELEQLSKKPGALWTNSTANATQDAASKIRDDPLLAIKMMEKQALKSILSNPMQMKKIKQSDDVKKALDKKRKKEEKKRKKEKKHKKDKHQKHDGEDQKVHVNASIPDQAHRDVLHTADDRKEVERKRSRTPSPSRGSSSRRRSRSRSPSPSRRPSRRSRSRSRSRSPRRSSSSYRRRSRSRSASPHRSRSSHHNGSSYGRDRHDSHRSHNNNDSYRNRNSRAPKISEEEKRRRLEEMMRDAEQNEDRKWKRIKNQEEIDKNDEEPKPAGPSNPNAKFLEDIHKKVYTEHNDQLEDRVRRNIHTIQRSSGTALMHEEGGLV